MYDQANDLRQLVRHCAGAETPGHEQRPGMIVVGSGKGGVGTTTVAVNLAVAFVQRGRRTALIDADPRSGDVALLCGLRERYTVADVLANKRTVSEALQIGPCGVRVVPGVWGIEHIADFPAAAGERLLVQLQNLYTVADVVVVDVGNGLNGLKRRLWRAADLRLAVTTPDTAAILDTYAAIKSLAGADTSGSVHTLVNRTTSLETTESVQARLAQACRRFLRLQPIATGGVPADPSVAVAARAGEPLLLTVADCGAARHIEQLAETLAGTLDTDPRQTNALKPHENQRMQRTA